MTFGLRNAAHTFMRFLYSVLRGLDFCFSYTDDILIASNDEAQHISHLKQVFQRLQDAGLVIKVVKCQFLQTEVDFLGHHISVNGIEPSKERMKINEDFKLPETVKELRRYSGVIKFYHRFIPNATENQAVLSNYFKGKKSNDKNKIYWTEESVQAFENSKRQLCKATVLHVPGKDNIIVDALSRIDELHLQLAIDYESITKAQEMDEELKEILSSHNSSLKLEKVPIFGSNFVIFCDCSAKKKKPYIPEAFRRIVFNNIHNLAHPGIRTNTKLLTSRFVWPSINKDARIWARSCIKCQKSKVTRHVQSPFQQYHKVTTRFTEINLDIIGPLPSSEGFFVSV
ncbi:transposon Tf2-12 polyprotein [Trichonephila inaurata madagascariensis]|uniref:RNA-directed DNA polymerase n=1 Tax=Trichonephila inaurata madagascariensis TaxID=2747483 RepID=A0A8X6XKQ1_9ARAC|nr:transposon Tf2-12 polyprotein [Trichonephila inaurata madagascariensis]